jgi:uncharacterized protein CbrC (UPF0167 family)|tara:strand:+ start:137 stop:310 length:174 start_codon:yes stop_codon:yes gene_type:complete
MKKETEIFMLNILKVKIIEIKDVLKQLEELSNAYIEFDYSANMNKRVKKALNQLNKI